MEKHNTLTNNQKFRLQSWLHKHRNSLKQEQPNSATVAKQATEELGFVCSERNIRSAAEAAEVKWYGRRSKDEAPKRQCSGHISAILATAIIELAKELGGHTFADERIYLIASSDRVPTTKPETINQPKTESEI
jgi:hypothetical protein